MQDIKQYRRKVARETYVEVIDDHITEPTSRDFNKLVDEELKQLPAYDIDLSNTPYHSSLGIY